MMWPFRRRRTSDLQRFFEGLPHVSAGRGGYSKMDRYRDFRRVFATVEGKRVLAQIISEAEGLPITEQDAERHAAMAYRAGKRALGLWIVRTLNAEPLDQPQE